MYNQLVTKEKTLAVIGLGYVGLPIALAFARKIKVIGFDINAKRIQLMQQGIDPSGELDSSEFEGCDITFTDSLEILRQASFFIVAVPTPIDAHTMPDLKPLIGASVSVGKALKHGDYVVYESTVYPGCTEEDCIPILERESGLKFPNDFKVGYSPERINPGDKEHTLSKITKVVSGCDAESLDIIAKVYELVVDAGVYKASSIKVAEAAKIIENTQRDLNIALMNELSMIFDKMKINTYEVLEAAGTKWNFLKFSPGLVGGHCIGVDPYYLTYKSKELGHTPEVILSGRQINDSMGAYVAKKTVQLMAKQGKDIIKSRVLVMGATFKENVEDIRNSKVADVVSELINFSVQVDVVDPYADSDELKHEYGFGLIEKPEGKYDAIVIAVNHKPYISLEESYFHSLSNGNGIVIDIKGVFRNKIQKLTYWSL
ncbi:nucleotide sugar dehydrogenase [Cytophagaceae bacterium DM2B3-1]|uniref:Nucleotide sugar dehydrogenase n=1 Tax=Xanthocytophaga flava TaxID=3048013 RepID=A0ABT7CDZ9_9BACT|nr:nucleotide sugar dehydrogenase [Xanthocytophaga flavus]MDJ1472708.1 nucleotide sugar dehydrogenase [Xanthocytophaga flavus]MDJ1491888.1 nucleotide sugar dehydrogenase [Xanthocytophaga flavus]